MPGGIVYRTIYGRAGLAVQSEGLGGNIVGTLLVGLAIAILADRKSYDEISGWMAERRRSLYTRWLGKGAAALESFFGPRLLGWRAFERCVALAFLYPIVFLLVGWVCGAVPTLDGKPLFPAGLAWPWRLAVSVALSSIAVALWSAVRWSDIIAAGIRRILPPGVRQHPFAVFATEGFVLLAAAAAAAAVTGTFAFAGAFAGAVAGAFAGAFAAIIVILYAALPVVNAALDWLSWAISRYLLIRLGRLGCHGADAGGWTITWHAVADLVAAVLLLAALAGLLPLVLQGTNALFMTLGWPAIEWWDYLATARNAPFTEGFLVTGMLLSTLVPTALHFLMLMVALLLPCPVFRRERWLDKLTEPNPSLLLKVCVVAWFFGSFVLSWFLLLTIAILLYAMLSAFGEDFGTVLAEIALWSGELVGPALPPGAGMP